MRPHCFGLFAAALLTGHTAALAQLPLAKLNWIIPSGARAGATNEITVSGSDLDEPYGLQFSDRRLTATAKPGSPSLFEVIVPAEVLEGLVDIRFVGRFGVSNPRAFAVGQLPEFSAPATNTSPASAVALPLETTANSRVTPNTAAWFRFVANAGQRIVVRVEASELDSRLVPDLTVTDADGCELALSRRRQWLDFTAPTNGSYLLKLHDQTFRGGDDYHFRLTLTTAPQLDFALPNVLRAGETNRVTLFGRNLPGGQPGALQGADGKSLEQLAVEIVAPASAHGSPLAAELLRKPASASLIGDSLAWRLSGTNAVSNPLLFALTTNAVEVAITNGLTKVSLPCEFSGIFPARGQLSGVTFQANKGDVLWLEVFADRIGFSSDPHAVVQRERNAKGENGETLYADLLELADNDANLGDREFNTVTRDSAARFEAPEAGTYRVLVRDLFNLGDGRPRYPYRLSLRRETPDFRLVALPVPPPRVGEDRNVHVLPVTLRRDQTVALKMLAFRRDGFNGDIELTATNLPPGVSAAATRIAAGQNTGILLLTASPDASGATNAVILGRSTIGTYTVTHSCPLSSVLWHVSDFNNENASARLHRDTAISVVSAELAPVSIAATETKPFEGVVDTKLSIPLRITRRGEFPAAFNLKPSGHPALDKAKEIAIPEKATNATAEINLAEAKLPVGTHTLWLQGSVTGKYRNNPEALAAAEAEYKAADQALASASGTDKPKAEERRNVADAAKKAAEERTKPRDVTVVVYSQPFIVTVNPAPKPEEKK
jgi:hypothetical protein